ncbi:hypothetical protein V3O60_10070 [Streptomyces xanthochromogenes]
MPVALPVLALAIGYALWRGLRRQALIAAATMAIVPLLVVPLKEWTDRPGPFDPATGYYPSGHTATAMVAYGSVALLLSPVVRRRRALARRRRGADGGDGHRSGAARLPLAPGRPGQLLSVRGAPGAQLHGYASKFFENSPPLNRSQLMDHVIRPRSPGQLPWVW